MRKVIIEASIWKGTFGHLDGYAYYIDEIPSSKVTYLYVFFTKISKNASKSSKNV
ncbi:hypothetical protein JCM19037_4614 [Geomicrobium sp. JCM 19037]|nr:hypothetical protein JCM19037_4614 [Geomicrobium sp. JCM 19037]